ncbi:hypothetical protein D9M69_645440 [compost metagenome]
MIIPNQLVDLFSVSVVFDELDGRGGFEQSTVLLATNAKDPKVGQVDATRQQVVIQRFIGRLLLHSWLDAIGRTQCFNQPIVENRIGFGAWYP